MLAHEEIQDNMDGILKKAKYIISNKSSLRKTGKAFGVSTNVVISDIRKLKNIDYNLYLEVQNILKNNVIKPEERQEEIRRISDRALKEANYIISNKSTLEKTAEEFKVSRTTVVNDIDRLKNIDNDLYLEVQKIIKKNIMGPERIKCISDRALKEARYIISNKSSLRKTGEVFKVSRTTVLKDIDRLENIDYDLYLKVQKIIKNNKKY